MIKAPFNLDERNVKTIHRIQSILYNITALTLVVIFVYRHNVLGQAFEEIWDIGILMVLNGFFMLGAVLYFGGITFQKFKLKYIVTAYIVFVLLVFIFKSFVITVLNDRPFSFSEIMGDMYIIYIICGLITAFFTLFWYLGKRKVDKELE